MRTLDEILSALRESPDVLLSATRDRIGGSRLAALRDYLHNYAAGACVVCGLPTVLDAPSNASNRAEVGHLVPASDTSISSARCGFVPGNVANFCHACNVAAADYTFTASDVRADLVPLAWPTLRKVRAHDGHHAQLAAMARQARGLPF